MSLFIDGNKSPIFQVAYHPDREKQYPILTSILKGVLTGTAAHCTMTFLKSRYFSEASEPVSNALLKIVPYLTAANILGTAAGAGIGYTMIKSLFPLEPEPLANKSDKTSLQTYQAILLIPRKDS